MAIDADHFYDKVVLLSGATGELGRELTNQLLERGARVALVVRKPWQVDRVREQVGSSDTLVACVPSQDAQAAAGAVKGAEDALGPIESFLCPSGAFAASPIGQDPSGQLQSLLEANLLAGATLARAVVGPMKRRRTGSLVFVGSSAVGSGGAGLANYLASKAALAEWVRALADELNEVGVRAAAVLPGTIDTQANRAAMPDANTADWLPLAAVARAILSCAEGSLSGSGPLYPLTPTGV